MRFLVGFLIFSLVLPVEAVSRPSKVGVKAKTEKQAKQKKKRKEKKKEEKGSWGSVVSPLFGVDDETGGKFGAALQFYRKGEPGFFFGVTLVGLNRLDLDVQLTDIKNWFIRSHTLLSRFTERYYGEGPATRPDNPLLIDADKIMERIWLLYQVTDEVRLGPAYILRLRRELDADREDHFINEDLAGVLPDETVAGCGLLFEWDRRNDRNNPSRGEYYGTSLWYFPKSMSNREGPESDFSLIEFDYRKYYPVTRKIVLANRARLEVSLGDPGYLFRPTLGGRKLLRGYGSNRFRGKHSYINQSELRWPVWGKYLSVVGSVDLGGVIDGGRTKVHASEVLGLRIGIPPAYNWKIRMEWGRGSDQDLFIIHLNETF